MYPTPIDKIITSIPTCTLRSDHSCLQCTALDDNPASSVRMARGSDGTNGIMDAAHPGESGLVCVLCLSTRTARFLFPGA